MPFLLKEVIKTCAIVKHKVKIGFVVPGVSPYNSVTASTRIRGYDIIRAFENDTKYHLELYRPFRKYDAVIFIKLYNEKAYQLAKKLQQQGTQIVFDININIFELRSDFVSEQQVDEGRKFATLSDTIITNSEYTENLLKDIFPKKDIYFIKEAIHRSYFKVSPKKSSPVEFIWVGYQHKAEALYLIKEVLLELFEQHAFSIKIISQENPHLDLGKIPVAFEPYRHTKITKMLSGATAFLAPRDLSDPYNLGHSFTKIGVAMAAGIPVIASPIPSYKGSPAIICNTQKEWRTSLQSLFDNTLDLEKLKLTSRRYCHENFDIDQVTQAYRYLFEQMMLNK